MVKWGIQGGRCWESNPQLCGIKWNQLLSVDDFEQRSSILFQYIPQTLKGRKILNFMFIWTEKREALSKCLNKHNTEDNLELLPVR